MSKNIPEAGRSRDKLIAKLKGINPVYACYADNCGGDGYCVLDEDKPFDCGICEREKIIDKFKCSKWRMRPNFEWIPAWSTSCNDVWELWDELPKPKEYFEDKNKTVISVFDLNLVIKGDSFADVVSKAWIKWKQNQ